MFSGELVTLGAIEREYLPRYVEWLNDCDIRRNLAVSLPYPYTVESEEEWFNHQRHDDSSRTFAILTRAENRLIGNCGLNKIDWTNRSALFGIFIGDKDYHNRGYGTDATRALLRYAFEEGGLHRVELTVFAFNPRAIRAYEKAGFSLEGRRRQALFREGQWHDELIMAILEDDWRHSRSA